MSNSVTQGIRDADQSTFALALLGGASSHAYREVGLIGAGSSASWVQQASVAPELFESDRAGVPGSSADHPALRPFDPPSGGEDSTSRLHLTDLSSAYTTDLQGASTVDTDASQLQGSAEILHTDFDGSLLSSLGAVLPAESGASTLLDAPVELLAGLGNGLLELLEQSAENASAEGENLPQDFENEPSSDAFLGEFSPPVSTTASSPVGVVLDVIDQISSQLKI
ncbi:hypothetical protein [Limnobacter sp.]|uniref:hypothetical protein n=1 Tax=Limnobacter sp. TaxID=2003368 RepID=UPI003511A82F